MIQDISDIYLKPIVLGVLDKGGKMGIIFQREKIIVTEVLTLLA